LVNKAALCAKLSDGSLPLYRSMVNAKYFCVYTAED
jgi:hypothetical protein